MRTAGTLVAVILALLWSALIWGGYGLLLMTTSFVTSNAGDVGLPPEMVGWAGLLDGFLQNYGTGAAALIWALGLLAILALRALFNRLIGAGRPRDTEPRPTPRLPEAPPQATRPTPPPVAAPPPVVAAPTGPARWGRDAAR